MGKNLHTFKPAPAGKTSAMGETRKMLPARYKILEEGKDRFLRCVESPNVKVFINRDFCVSGSAARKYPECSIFLDGAAKGEPFMDVQNKVYNLDHHEDCVRSFTLSTCEQAMVLILKGLDLGVGDWSIYANEPDLDTVLAIWLIMNYMRVGGEDSEIRDEIMPLLRVEGVIDCHGLDMTVLTGYPEGLQEQALKQIESLRSTELELKTAGTWGSTDELEFVTMQLRAIDELFYSSRHFEGIGKIEELFRIKIGQDKIAIACTSQEGIYETEEALKKTHGARLGLLLLQKDANTYTVRQVDPFLPTNLKRLYDRLNLMDPLSSSSSNWAGSEEIGGSPRGKGTGLDINEIKNICRWVYNKPIVSERLSCILRATGLTLCLLLLSAIITFYVPLNWDSWSFNVSENQEAPLFFLSVLFLSSMGFMLLDKKHSWRFYGFNRTKGKSWLLLFPLVLLTVFFNGMVPTLRLTEGEFQITMLLILLAPISWEVLFRGVFWGVLQNQMPTMRHKGKWFLSIPNLVTTLGSTLAMLWLFQCTMSEVLGDYFSIWWCFGMCALYSFLMGVARERGESLLASTALSLSTTLISAYLLRAL